MLQELKELLLQDLYEEKRRVDPSEEAKQLKDRIRTLEFICKGSSLNSV